MKIFTLGNGFIANHLEYPKITQRVEPDQHQIAQMIEKYKPDCIINAIGYCGIPNIDQCEIEKEKTYRTNVIIPTLLALECEKKNIRLIQLSSGCIFSGQSPHLSYHIETEYYEDSQYPPVYYPKISDWKDTGYRENDPADPISTYSKSKYACDLLLQPLKNTTCLRIRMPISDFPSPRNLLNKLISYSKVIELPNSVSFMNELVRIISWVVEKEKTGIYHCTNPEPIKHSQLLEEYRKYFPDHQYQKISEYELSQLVKAPRSNCILDSSKLLTEGFQFQNVKELIQSTVKQFVINNNK